LKFASLEFYVEFQWTLLSHYVVIQVHTYHVSWNIFFCFHCFKFCAGKYQHMKLYLTLMLLPYQEGYEVLIDYSRQRINRSCLFLSSFVHTWIWSPVPYMSRSWTKYCIILPIRSGQHNCRADWFLTDECGWGRIAIKRTGLLGLKSQDAFLEVKKW